MRYDRPMILYSTRLQSHGFCVVDSSSLPTTHHDHGADRASKSAFIIIVTFFIDSKTT